MSEPMIVRNTSDLVEAFRAIKAELGLSNDFVDEIGGLTKGGCDKVLGPTRFRNISPMLFDLFCELFAVEFVMRVNPESAQRMADRWEQRIAEKVRIVPVRMGATLIERAKPIVLAENARKGGFARANQHASTLVDQCRRAGRARARKMSRKERRALAQKAGIASAKKRKANSFKIETSPQSCQAPDNSTCACAAVTSK